MNSVGIISIYQPNFFIEIMKKSIALLLLISVNFFAQAQEDFFYEMKVSTNLVEKESFYLEVNTNWKHVYNEVGWRRLGVAGMATKKINNWSLYGGLSTFYTFNKDIVNYLEIRPRIGLGLTTPIVDRLSLNQRLLGEWRNHFYSKENRNRSYTRSRYRVLLNYTIAENKEKQTAWKVKPSIEWYFTKNVAYGERFAESRRYTLMLSREFKNKDELSIGYRYENFIKLLEQNKIGHLVLLEYSF